MGRTSGFAIALALLSGCGAGGNDAAMVDAGEDIIIDCYETLSCEGGRVYHTYGSDISDDWTCGHQPVLDCPDGCDAELSSFWEYDVEGVEPSQLCAGAPDAQLGDACLFGRPCWPTHATTQPDGSVTQTYLTCGEDSRCEETSAPQLERWLTPCSHEASLPSEFRGVVEGGYHGACLVERAAGCEITATSLPCRGDWECPTGATCDHSIPSTFTVPRAVCRPGPRGAVLSLGCAAN